MTTDAEKLHKILRQSLVDGSVQRIVLSRPRQTSEERRRIDIRPVIVRGENRFQFTHRQGTQEVHINLTAEETATELQGMIGEVYRDCLLRDRDSEWSARFSKRGRCSLKCQKNEAPAEKVAHDRSRSYLIPDGQPVPFLIETGVMSKQGQVRAKHYRKFRQINRYVEFIRDVMPRLPQEGVLRIVDFGSGKSYLTFATHYFLTKILNREVKITGLDRRSDVIETCQAIAEKLLLEGLEFVTGDIADYAPTSDVDLAISLHACDTATDDALAAAVSWNTNVILAVPCCQHELAAAMPADNTSILATHGIVHERFSELATDAVRAGLLECVGYNASIVEFIELEHTARNLLIRAFRREVVNPTPSNRDYWNKLRKFCDDFGLPPLHLQKKLEEFNLLDTKTLNGSAEES